MNLHALVRGAISTVNPDRVITLRRSTGYTTDANYQQVPQYETLRGSAQIQPLSSGDIRRAEFLNLQGVLRSVYLYGNWHGIVRVAEKGGDILVFPEQPGGPDREWKVVAVDEAWPDWTKVTVCLQAST